MNSLKDFASTSRCTKYEDLVMPFPTDMYNFMLSVREARRTGRTREMERDARYKDYVEFYTDGDLQDRLDARFASETYGVDMTRYLLDLPIFANMSRGPGSIWVQKVLVTYFGEGEESMLGAPPNDPRSRRDGASNFLQTLNTVFMRDRDAVFVFQVVTLSARRRREENHNHMTLFTYDAKKRQVKLVLFDPHSNRAEVKHTAKLLRETIEQAVARAHNRSRTTKVLKLLKKSTQVQVHIVSRSLEMDARKSAIADEMCIQWSLILLFTYMLNCLGEQRFCDVESFKQNAVTYLFKHAHVVMNTWVYFVFTRLQAME